MDQSDWIKEVMKHRPEGFDPYVEKHFDTDEGLQYGSWNKYKGQKNIDERSIFPNEIVIDIDAEDTDTARQENSKVLSYLDTNGYDYILADTGGTGFHIHLFFKYNGIEIDQYRDYRVALFRYLKKKCREEVNADTRLWDEQPVRFDITNSKGHLVRAIGGRKSSSRNRKTMVLPSSLKKNQVTNPDDVEYPSRVPWMLEISKTGTKKADLSINQIQDEIEQVKKQEEEMHNEKTNNTSFDTKVQGLEDVRDIPASQVLEMIDKDFKKNQNFECPFHEDSNPSANLYTREEVERLYCFSDTCAEDRPPKVWNAVDILVEEGYTFKEALEKLSKGFDIQVKIGYNPNDYFAEDIKGNYVVRPQLIADEIMDEYRFKNVIGKGFYVWKEGYWQEIDEDNDIVGTEVDKRLQNETAARHRNNVRDIIENTEEIKVDKEDFETPDNLVPFNNGTYNLDTGELQDKKPSNNFDFKYEIDYVEDPCNTDVQDFIDTLMPESEEKRQKLRDIAALCMAPTKINQKVPIFYGQGSNGKNQFVKIIWKMLGKESYHKTSARKLQKDNFEMASVVDKQMAFFDEFEDASKPGQLKTMVGDENQNVREMRKESYTRSTSVYPIFAANELPKPSDNSDGFYRRWEIIDFQQKFTPEKDDGNPDRIPPKKLEETYMNKEALDAFGSSLMHDLQQIMERNKLTGQQSTREVRREWRKKGNALYAFIDKFLASGDLPDEDTGETDDWIVKDELLEIINNYMEAHNNSKIQKHRLTKAIDSHPDLRAWSNYRPSAEDGSRPRAYAGIVFDENHVQDVQRFLGFNAYTSAPVNKVNELGKWLDIVDNPNIGKTLIYLSKNEDHQVPLFELVREVGLEHSDVPDLNACDFIEMDTESVEGQQYPTYKIDYVAIDQSDAKIDFENGKIERPYNFVKDQVENWGSDEEKDVEELLVELSGDTFGEEKIEQIISEMKDDGVLYEPEPGVVKKL